MSVSQALSNSMRRSGRSGAGSEPVRVVILIDHLGHPNGVVHGPSRLLLEQLPRLNPAAVTPTLCVLRERHPVAEEFERIGFAPVFLGRGKWDPRAVTDIVRVLRGQGAQVAHLMGEKAMLLGRIAARRVGCRAIIHLRDTKPPTRPVRFLARRLAPWTDLALGCADSVTELAVRDWAIPPDRARTLMNGINVVRFAEPRPDARERMRTEVGVSPEAPVAITVGRMAPEKGHALLIDAMRTVLVRRPDAVLLVAGAGPTLGSCRELAERFGIAHAVRFLGQRSDIPELLAAADAFVLPSRWGEGLPGAAVEAIAAGRPVVAFPVAGVSDIVLHDRTGLLVPRDDVDALADALTRVLLDADLRARLAQGCREHSARFRIEENVRRLQSIYLEVARLSSIPAAQTPVVTAVRSAAGA